MKFLALDHYAHLNDYGIEIPFLGKKFETLKQEVTDAKEFNVEIHNKIPSFQNLSLTFHPTFLRSLDKKGELEVFKAYELIDHRGHYHRFSPSHHQKENFSELINFCKKTCEASFRACEQAIDHSFCYFLGGGFHHGYPDFGSGFCLLNDIAYAIQKIQRIYNNSLKILILDVDAHFGDGTAFFFQENKNVYTLSIHMKKGWPLDGSLLYPQTHSNLDIPVGPDENYLNLLKVNLEQTLHQHQFDLALIVQGSDPYEKDALQSSHEIALTRDELNERDRFVFDLLKKHQIQQAYVMSGGYGEASAEIYRDFFDYLKFVSSQKF